MHDFFQFLCKPTSIITLVIPISISLILIIYECFNLRTEKKYFVFFIATLIVGYFSSFWDVSVTETYCGAALHIFPLFMCVVSFGAMMKWSISSPMIVTLSYLQVLSIDLMVAYKTDMALLFMTKGNLDSIEAHMVATQMGHWYNGVGGAGWFDALFLAFTVPLVLVILNKLDKRNNTKLIAKTQ